MPARLALVVAGALLTTRTMSVIAVPLVVVPRRFAQWPWGFRTSCQPQAIICMVVGPHQ